MLVTGSTAGIGFAAAAGLCREGASVVVNGCSRQRVEEAVEKIRDTGGDGEVSGIAADLSTAEGVADLVRQLPELDILINNLGIFDAQAVPAVESETPKAGGRDRTADLGVSPPARHQQVEQDRASDDLPHHRELARATAGEPRGGGQSHLPHDDEGRAADSVGIGYEQILDRPRSHKRNV